MSDIFEFEDKAKVERLIGTLHDPAATTGNVLTVQADKSIAAQPGGSAAAQAVYQGNNVAILDGATTALTWDTLGSGTDLLDRSTPAAPTFLTDGTYAITVLAAGDALTVAGYAEVVLFVAGIGVNGGYTQAPADGWGTSATAVVAAGDALGLFVRSFDGAATRDYALSVATVVKLS